MKRSKLIINLLALVVALLIFWIISASFSHSGKEQWEGKYEEIAYFRNENNTGPIIRILAVRVKDENPDWMEDFGNAQPHSKYGRTLVFYFRSEFSEKVKLSPKEPFFPEEYRPFLLAQFEKTPMAERRFLLIQP